MLRLAKKKLKSFYWRRENEMFEKIKKLIGSILGFLVVIIFGFNVLSRMSQNIDKSTVKTGDDDSSYLIIIILMMILFCLTSLCWR